MAKCFSYTTTQDSCFRYSFSRAGLKSSTTDLGDGDTIMHCWSPKSPSQSKPNLILIHGFGASPIETQSRPFMADLWCMTSRRSIQSKWGAWFWGVLTGVCLEDKDMVDEMFQV
ncbi:hypothetical protein LINGRAHAP2_LOCUS15580 [Linum grandiflorum]